jgi:acetyl-CoA acetyltransferase
MGAEQDVFIVGVGMTPFGKHRGSSLEALGQAAVQAALDDAGIARSAVDEAICGSGYGGPLIGQRVLRDLGMTGPPVFNVENACSSGATAVREGIAAIRSGRSDTVLAFGLDQLTALGGGTLPLADADVEVQNGMSMPALYAMRARRHMHEFGTTREDLADVVVKSRRHAQHNPYAHFRTPTARAEVLAARMIADPLQLPMCSPTSDGAAAVILSAQPSGSTPVRLAASILQSGSADVAHDLAVSELGSRVARMAYEAAGLGPEDVDLAEVHDAFSIAELMYYEAFGFCAPGEAPAMLARGDSAVGGRLPVNPSGGLISRGHPIGATGIAQMCEAVWQLRGEAGGRQVEGARVALTHCSGGGIAGLDHGAAAVHVLVR